MEVTQIADIVNKTTAEVTGTEAVSDVDLNKVVETGAEVLDNDKLIDNYVKTLIDHIGKVVFVNRPYTGSTPSVMMDSWEYGAILEKIQYEGLPEAEENDSWNLVDGQSYDPNVFHKPTVSAKFYSERRTFDIEMSFARRQVKSAFSTGAQVQAFFAMIETAISNGMTVKMDSLVQLTIANAIATVYNNKLTKPVQYYDLVTAYKTATGDNTVTPENAMVTPAFTRWAAMTMKRVIARMRKLSTLFNAGGKYRHTPADRLHLILHSDFTAAAEAYLYGDTYHNEFIKLPQAEEVPFWQGSGTSFGWLTMLLVSHLTVMLLVYLIWIEELPPIGILRQSSQTIGTSLMPVTSMTSTRILLCSHWVNPQQLTIVLRQCQRSNGLTNRGRVQIPLSVLL